MFATKVTEQASDILENILECLYSFECLIPYSEFNKNTNSISTIVSYSDKLNMFMSKYSKDLESHLITSDS